MSLLLLDRPVWIVIIYAVTGAIFMPLLAALLLYLNNNREWLQAHTNTWLGKSMLGVSLLVFGYLLMIQLSNQL